MSDIVYTALAFYSSKGGGSTMDGSCCSSYCGSGMRQFLTREEKIELLNEYKQRLDSESKGVAERIADLQKEED